LSQINTTRVGIGHSLMPPRPNATAFVWRRRTAEVKSMTGRLSAHCDKFRHSARMAGRCIMSIGVTVLAAMQLSSIAVAAEVDAVGAAAPVQS
jgi:hypothetical protein